MKMHWATLALNVIKDAIDDACSDTAITHLEETIASILTIERNDFVDAVQSENAGPKTAATSHSPYGRPLFASAVLINALDELRFNHR